MNQRTIEEAKQQFLNNSLNVEAMSDKELVGILKALEKQVKILSDARIARVEKLKSNCPI